MARVVAMISLSGMALNDPRAITYFRRRALTVFQSIAYYQNLNMGLVWIARRVNLDLLGFHVPVVWFASVDSLVCIIAVAPLIAFWRRQAISGREPVEIVKIAIGAWIAAVANLLLMAGSLFKGPISILYPITYDVLLGVAFLYYWPTAMALVSRAAPPAMRSTLMGLLFMSLFVANLMLGWIGTFYDRVPPASFWGLHAAISAAGGLLAIRLARPLMHALGCKP